MDYEPKIQHTITLYKSEVYEGVWELYCKAVDLPTTCDQITIAFYKDDVEGFWEEDDLLAPECFRED